MCDVTVLWPLGLISATLLNPVLGEAGNRTYVTTRHPFIIFKIAQGLNNSATVAARFVFKMQKQANNR